MRERAPLRRLAPFLLLPPLLLALALPVFAQNWRSGETILIAQDEVIPGDLYINATTCVMDGTVQGDLIALGRSVVVNGTVEGDLWVAGQAITVNGAVTGDVRVAGMALYVGPAAHVGEDVMLYAYALQGRAGSQIDGSLTVVGVQALVDGTVGDELFASVNSLDLEGSIGGKATVEVGAPGQRDPFNPTTFDPNIETVPTMPSGLVLGDKASIGGHLEYTSPEPLEVDRAKVRGEIVHVPSADVPKKVSPATMIRNMTTNALVRSVRRLIAWGLVGLLLARLLPVWITRPAGVLRARAWPSLGRGAAIVALFPVGVILFVIVVAFVTVSLVLLTLPNLASTAAWLGAAVVLAVSVAFGLAVTYLTRAIVGYWIGRWVLSRVRPAWAENPLWPTLVGLVILVLLTAIPVAGLALGLLCTCLGLGTLWFLWRESRGGQAMAEVIRTA